MSENGDQTNRRQRTVQGEEPPQPPIPPEIREAARLVPDHWLGLIDPAWSGADEPPRWAVVGEWRTGHDGEISEWRANDEYRPSPKALGWPKATDAVDEAVQLAATGYGPGDAVLGALAKAEVVVLLAPDGQPLSSTTPDGSPVIPVFTSLIHLKAAGRFGHMRMPTTDLLPLVPEEQVLHLNPSGPVSMTVDPEILRERIAAAQEPAASAAATPDAGRA